MRRWAWPLLAILFQGDGPIGADVETQGAAVAGRGHLGLDGVQLHRRFRQDNPGPGHRRLGLGHGFIQGLGMVAETGYEQAVHGQIHRPQLGMGLVEEAVGVDART